MEMVSQDDREAYEQKLAFTEYLASFSNPEAVEKIVKDRANKKKYLDDEGFAQMLEREHGSRPRFQETN